MRPGHFIAVEGPIGAGKTTLAAMLARELGAPVVNEIVEENPYLGKFYQNMEDWSFQLEMFFLCNRFKQLEDEARPLLESGRTVVADYHMYKNLIFGERTLNGSKREKYRQIYHLLMDDQPRPDIVIYIKADLPTLLRRIGMRGREIEQAMDPGYLSRLIEDYEEAMPALARREPGTAFVTVDGGEIDFVENPAQFREILSQVKEHMQ
ncbi:AAA family ATPase [Paenibacillus spiritus]|uniref:AAA family ATPase n=1 Tax=Paenibacillus spiritus TaxID=2496557 RepID=A0A5J5G0F4_9BACL|nr:MULTISPECIES: deoxynucleoside kinase [Paenibacillus]KAA8999776.1 AAA family ATPase [Paenibacillus spiritus]